MKYDYSKMDGVIGHYQGVAIYGCERNSLWEVMPGVWYIVYDDGNKLVEKIGSGPYYCHGTVDNDGTVHLEKQPYVYYLPEEREEEKPRPQVEESNDVIGDVKLGLDIDKVLAEARTLKVDDLLKDFNYGL